MKKEDHPASINEVRRSKFDLGLIQNFQEVFGKNILSWLLPIKTCKYDYNTFIHILVESGVYNIGLSFKVNSDFRYEILNSTE